MTATAASVAAEAEWLRDKVLADCLARDLGCEVTLHPRLVGVVEAREPAPGLWLASGTPDEIRAAAREAWLRHWLPFLGTLSTLRGTA